MKLTSVLLYTASFLASSHSAMGSSLLDNAAFGEFVEKYGEGYDHRHCMGPDTDVCILWKINTAVDQPQIELAVAAGGRGWVGFGISEAGSMPGSDIMAYEAQADTIGDYHALAYGRPTQDTCESDWKMVGTATVEDGLIAVRVVRALDTGDSQDHVFLDDSDLFGPATSIIAAWGDDASMTYHGPNAARSIVRFFAPSTSSSTARQAVDAFTILTEASSNAARKALEETSEGSILVHETDYLIPTTETTYHQPCFNVTDYFTPEQLEQGVYLTGVEYVPSKDTGGADTTPHLHHMTAQGGDTPCQPPGTRTSSKLFYSWAPGGHPLVFPPNVGLKVGGGDGLYHFQSNIHYDNRNEVPGQLDSSGVRWYYVNAPREHEMGVMLMGDAIVNLRGNAVGAGPTGHSFECPGSCSESLIDGPVTVFAEYLHEHETGARVVNEIIRDGTPVNRAAVETFDFLSNGLQPVMQKPFEIQPGDSFKTTCYYDNVDNTTLFGFGTREEMCQSMLLYYPASTKKGGYCSPNSYDTNCSATYEKIETDATFGRLFGKERAECPEPGQNDIPTSVPDMMSSQAVVKFAWSSFGLAIASSMGMIGILLL